MMLNAARRSRRSRAPARRPCATATASIEEEINGLRGLIRELRPAALDELGLAAAIEGLATRLSERAGVAVEAQVQLARTAAYAGARDRALPDRAGGGRPTPSATRARGR